MTPGQFIYFAEGGQQYVCRALEIDAGRGDIPIWTAVLIVCAIMAATFLLGAFIDHRWYGLNRHE